MDYLAAGRTILLGETGRVTVGYLNSCMREEVVGGTVTIGVASSVIVNGKVRRQRVECDGGKLLLTAEQAGKSGAIVFRRGTSPAHEVTTKPSLRIFSREPVLRIAARPSVATLERLDRAEGTVSLPLQKGKGVADLATMKKPLAVGGVYRVTGGGKSRVFQIDPAAKNGGPLLGRLVAF